ncbi:MAG: insertase [Hyphomicrobiales bacterium]|nr:insertase [Hyphomicrobiales bacterium]
MNDNNRNMILAIVLSVIVLFGWQYFIAGPQMQRAQQQAELAAAQQKQAETVLAPKIVTTTNADGTTSTITEVAGVPVYADTAAALAATPRVKIDTPALTGSINLMGARLDDLKLKGYRETTNKDSPIISLLSPVSQKGAYFVEQGWVTPQGTTAKLPDGKSQWTVEGANSTLTPTTPVTLKYDNGEGLIFRRTFALDPHYMFTVTQSIENQTKAPVTLLPYARAVRNGTPPVQNFFVLHEGPVGVLGDKNLVSFKYSDIQKQQQSDVDSNGGWLGFTDKYWATAVMPEPKTPIAARYSWSKPAAIDVYQTSYVEKTPVTIAPGATGQNKSYVFAGAKEEAVIASYESTYGIDRLELLIDWGWFQILTKPMFYLLRFLNGVIGNFGLAILTLTIIVKALFFPLANRSYASMAAMRRVQPEMKAIQERFKDDRPAQQQATMELYKREKINPISGCWPVLIQIPVFFSLYTVIFISLEMRQAPFFGWIQDLASPDPTNIFTLFGLIPWDPTALPFVGHFLALGIWPVIMGITMWVQMKLNPPPPDPTQAMIFQFMPVIFTFMLGTFPAGLVIYWAWNNTLSVTQQWFIMKRHGAEVNLLGNIVNSFKRKPVDKAS